MKPELVTIQKIRLIQLGGAAVMACLLSFYAGYCFRGPGQAQSPEHIPQALEQSGGAPEQLITRVDPEKLREKAGVEMPPPKAPEEKRVERVFEKAQKPANQTEPAKRKESAPPAPASPATQTTAQKPIPAPKPAAKEKETPKPAGGAKFTIQAASFKDSKDAEKLADSLTKNGYPAYVREAAIKGETWHRVRVGTYATAEEAKRISAKLNAERKIKSVAVKYE